MGVSSVVGVFETVVAVLPVVMCFQSLILDMAGNVGTQSLAVTIRVLMDETLSTKQKFGLVVKEMRVGFCNGLFLGILVTSLIYKFILATLGLTYLQTIVFILVIAALVQFVEMFLKKSMPALYESLGVYLPLITTNCAVLGVALNSVQYGYNILQSVVYGFGISVGFTIAIVILAGIREKMEYNDIPESWQGMPIVMVTAGLMSIAFFGFSGII